MKRLFPLSFATALVFSISFCFAQKKSSYQDLQDYEGEFEYSNPAALVFSASNFDTTLYAIIDEAKYPLKFINVDTFLNPQKNPVIFQRDRNGNVKSYNADRKVFQRLSSYAEKTEWFPRKDLYGNENAYRYQSPSDLHDGLVTGDIHQSFSNPEKIFEMVRQTIHGTFPDVHSILIWKDGKLVVEEYFYEYNESKPHQLRSASKSFIGTLAGIAIDQKYIKSENELLLPFFKKEYGSFQNMDSHKEKITVKDFLTYRHGLDCNDEDPNTKGYETKMYESNDWIKYTIDLPTVGDPGRKSSYCTGCAQTIGRLVEITTKTPLVDYAAKNLFAPMGITNYKWRFKPDPSSAATFNQMYLRPRDMMKLAIMYLQNGQWQGKQIVSKEWITKTFERDDVEFGYLWRHKNFDVDGKNYQSYLATGNGGQKINIWPELNMITVFTGGNYNAYLFGRTTPPNEMIPNFILKAL